MCWKGNCRSTVVGVNGHYISFVNNISWSTQSNSLLRSINVAIATLLSSKHFKISSVNFNRACSVIAPVIKPNRETDNILLMKN